MVSIVSVDVGGDGLSEEETEAVSGGCGEQGLAKDEKV